MLLAAPGGRSIDGRSRVAVSAIATARAIALLTAVFLLALPHAARAQDDAASAAAASAVIASLPHDLSPWSMFMNADIVVKATMVGLAFASLVTWTVWLAKGLELFITRRRASAAMRILVSTSSLDEAARQIETSASGRGGAGDLVKAALLEMRRSAGLSAEGAKERLAIALTRIEARAGRAMGRGAGLLATIGSTAPFVGLFGAVWGIMNSFVGISRAYDQSGCCRARHSRGAARNRDRSRRRDSGSDYLQQLRAQRGGLSRAARRCVRRGASTRVSRSGGRPARQCDRNRARAAGRASNAASHAPAPGGVIGRGGDAQGKARRRSRGNQ